MEAPLHVYIVSLGCPKNQVDTEKILGSLGEAFAPAQHPDAAQVLLVNTCGFLQAAVEESLETIIELAQGAAQRTPRPLLVVTGCLVARYGHEVLAQEIPEVDLWADIAGQEHLAAAIMDRLGRPPRAHALGRVITTPPSFAYLKIAEGCTHRCRFCTIPTIRGPLRSRPVEAIVEEAAGCVAAGRSELVLVAQDLTAYGRDLGLRRGLSSLLDALVRVPGLRWVRLMYLYPSGLSEDFLRCVRDLGAPLLPYFDVPFQHAHPQILASMGRPFGREDPRAVVDRIRRFFPAAALRTSLIVGYPGEGEEHFATLESFVREVEFTHVGVFAFSPEEGTPAAEMPQQVPSRERQARRRHLLAVQRRISRRNLAAWKGREIDVIVDRPSPEWPGLYEGRAWFQAPEVDGVVYVSGPQVGSGAMVRARVDACHDWDLVALVEDEGFEE